MTSSEKFSLTTPFEAHVLPLYYTDCPYFFVLSYWSVLTLQYDGLILLPARTNPPKQHLPLLFIYTFILYVIQLIFPYNLGSDSSLFFKRNWCLLFIYFLPALCNMQDLSSLISGVTQGPPAMGVWRLNPWTTREALQIVFLVLETENKSDKDIAFV